MWPLRILRKTFAARTPRPTATILALVLALSFGLVPMPVFAQGLTATAGAQATTPQYLKDWRRTMAHVPTPKKGCFSAAYPGLQWQEVPCTTAPSVPYPPARGPRPGTVGDTSFDVTAKVTGLMSEAVGSFDSVTGVTSVTSTGGSGGIDGPNAYTLQLNTNTFSTPVCSGKSAQCQGWQQFVFESSSPLVFMQYWLIDYGQTCPSAAWASYFDGVYYDCYTNSNATSVPSQSITTLADMSVEAIAVSGGVDTVAFGVGSTIYEVQNTDSLLDLAAAWQQAEFNVFGDGGGSEAVFNSGATIVVRTSAYNGTAAAPSCDGVSYTGETNNLNLQPASGTPASGTLPALVFTESTASGATSPCASAIAVGGTNQATLTVSEVGSGTVTSSQGGIDCVSGTGTCSAGFAPGTQVSLSAAPANGWTFSGWSGACGGTGTCSLTMNSAANVTATFAQGFTLSASTVGSGTVTSSPSGINCGATCSAGFASGTQVNLFATPANGWKFSGWSGACSGSGTCSVTMNANESVIANFTQNNETLAVSKTGSGTVTSSPSGINCGATCSASFAQNSQVSLTASAANGWTFAGWGGVCGGTGACNVTMFTPENVSATFTQNAASFILSVSESGSGTVTSSPSGINCGAACSASFPAGVQVNLTATPAGGSSFAGWSGACSGTGACSVTMNAAKSVSATFTQSQSFNLTLNVTGNGSVTSTAETANSESTESCGGCTETFAAGSVVTLTPNPAAGWSFAAWSGACSGDGTCVVTMNGAQTVGATFQQGAPLSSPLVAAVLPLSRSATLNQTVTAFATIVNSAATTAPQCAIAPVSTLPVIFHYQPTNPATNQVIGSLDTPIDIPATGSQSFVFSVTPVAAFSPTQLIMSFACSGVAEAPIETGIDTLLLSASANPTPDIVALAASGDPGYVDILGATGAGAFAVATINLGADATITVAANTGSVSLPVTLTVCQTNPASGACLAAPAASVSTDIPPDATPTFGIFAAGSGMIADSPGADRVFVTFSDASGAIRGETSVAVRTQ